MNIDEIFREMEAFQRKVLGSVFGDSEESNRFKPFRTFDSEEFDPFKDIFDGLKGFDGGEFNNPQGEWRFERIDRPGVKGFIAKGIISHPEILKKPDDILPPLRPEPNRPRRPLYDIHSEEGQLRIFIELPGVKEDDINLEVMDGVLRLHANDFEEEIDLNRWILDSGKLEYSYRNGILEVTIPKEDLEAQMV
jgi:HSP20 family molecular chaperone IbpA